MILQKTREISGDSPASKAMIEMLFYIPLDIDLALHAAPAIALTLDFFLFERKYSQKATYVLAPLVALVYAIWYGWWVERCGARNNGICMYLLHASSLMLTLARDPYPFLTDNPFSIRLGIYAGAGSIAPLSFWILNSIHS